MVWLQRLPLFGGRCWVGLQRGLLRLGAWGPRFWFGVSAVYVRRLWCFEVARRKGKLGMVEGSSTLPPRKPLLAGETRGMRSLNKRHTGTLARDSWSVHTQA